MDLLIIISNSKAGPIVTSLADACHARGLSWAVFFTGKGVRCLADEKLVSALAPASEAIACQEAWAQHMANSDCPITPGSQTNNSALVGAAARILSL